MRRLQIIILFILGVLTLKSQDKQLVDFIANCNEDKFENFYQLKRQSIAYDINYNLLSIELVVKPNCAEADTGFIRYSNDTLFLYSDFKMYKEIINGDTLIVAEQADCDCAFYLSYDIYGFSQMPNVILHNNEPIELNRFKYLPSETQIKNGKQELLNDNFGFLYRTIYYESGLMKEIIREKGIKRQYLKFDEKGLLKEIDTYKGDFDNIISIKLE